jgi:hypothetical protein
MSWFDRIKAGFSGVPAGHIGNPSGSQQPRKLLSTNQGGDQAKARARGSGDLHALAAAIIA